MREKDFISIIKNTLSSDYIGDDCAYLKDLGIVITQDSLVEDVHFSRKFMTAYQLGYKSVAVNISDICASGAEPKYLTVALSLPSDISNDFVKEFYEGAKLAGVEIVGGDITGSGKIFISVCALGSTKGRKISSRSNAKIGYKVVVAGKHGSSAMGLNMLMMENKKVSEKFIKAHLEPVPQIEICKQIGENIKVDYAMMDTSDGLMDAFSTIANESGVLLKVDFDKIPKEKEVDKNLVLFGGEDYGIVAVVPKDFECGGVEVGEAVQGLGVDLIIDSKTVHYSKKDVENKVFNHFRRSNEV